VQRTLQIGAGGAGGAEYIIICKNPCHPRYLRSEIGRRSGTLRQTREKLFYAQNKNAPFLFCVQNKKWYHD